MLQPQFNTKATSHTSSDEQTLLCGDTEPTPVAEGTGEAAAEGDAAPEATPPAEDVAEGEEDEGDPPKPEYSKNMLEYVAASSGQVSLSAHAQQTSCSKHVPSIQT